MLVSPPSILPPTNPPFPSSIAIPNPHPPNTPLTPHSCLTARRRRKAGRQPFYGTGWAARPGNNNAYGQNTTAPYYNNQHNPAPPYSAATTNNNNGGYYGGGGANQGYYGQQNGVELQSPQPTYGGGYAPPPGPPPTKG